MRNASKSGSSSSRRKLWWRIPLYVVGGVFALIVVAGLLTQTGWFKNEIRSRLEQAANDALRARVSIGSLSGSLLFSAELEDIAITLDGDSVLSISSVRASYSPWALLSGVLEIDLIAVDTPRVWLRQDSDGEWNAAGLTNDDTTDAPQSAPGGSEDGGVLFDIIIEKAALYAGSVQIEGADPPIPSLVSQLNLEASARITDNNQRVSIQSLRFRTDRPEFTLQDLTAVIARDDSVIAVSDLEITTAQNQVVGSGHYFPEDLSRSEADLRSDSLLISEFAFVLPDLPLDVEPSLSMDITLRDDTARAEIIAEHEDQRLDLNGTLWPFAVVATDSVLTAMHYEATIALRQVNWGEWLAMATLNAVTTGTITVNGTGFDPESAQASLSAELAHGTASGYEWDTVSVAADYDQGEATISSEVSSRAGTITVDGTVGGLVSTAPHYSLTARLSGLDLSLLNGDTLLRSDLSGSIQVSGTHFDPDSISGRVNLSLSPSQLGTARLDTLFARVDASRGRVDVDSFFVKSTVAEAAGFGYFVPGSRELSLNAVLTPGDLGEVAGLVGLDTLSADGMIDIAVHGSLDTMIVNSEFNLAHVRAMDVSVDSASGKITVPLADVTPGQISLEVEADAVRYGEILLGDIVASSSMAHDTLTTELRLSSGDSLAVLVAGDVVAGDVTRVLLKEMSLDYHAHSWSMDRSPITIAFDTSHISVDSLIVSSGSGEQKSVVAVDGIYALQGDHNLHFELNRLSVGAFLTLMASAPEIDGRLSGDVDWKGPAADPDFVARIKVTEMTAAEVAVDSLTISAQYVADSMGFAAQSYFPEFPTLTIEGFVPFTMAVEQDGSTFPTDQPMQVRVITERLPLSALVASVPGMFDDIAGYAVCSLTVGNTLEEPHMSGRAGIYNASVRADRYGVDYEDVQLRLSMEQQKITIDSLSARRGKGRLSAGGYLQLAGRALTGEVEATSIDLTADEFYVTRHNHYEVQVSGNLGVTADANDAEYHGSITVHRARLYLPALTAEGSVQDVSSQGLPMLVRAVYDSTRSGAMTAVSDTSSEDNAGGLQTSRLYERMRGRATVALPRNTWIRSPDMRIELSGKVDVVKEGPEPELFGTINTVRGHYDLYGRRFNIREGQLIFQGGTDYNPRLSITAEYVFRSAERIKQTLVLFVSGTAEQPKLNFELNGAEISEGDALAYILFGRSFDQLTRGQQGAVGERSGGRELAQGLAAGIVADQLAKTLGRELRLDVIDIRAKEDWAGAAFEVGKYLTTDLFVSYQRGFGSAEDNEFAPEIVTLEYELTRRVFLRLIEGNSRQSGFDVIFRLRD